MATDFTVIFGGQWEKENADSANGSAFFRTIVDASQRSGAGYASLQGRLFERLDVTAGIRYDGPEGYDGFTSWRLGAVLAVPEVSSRLRVSGGTSFKAPSLFQRYGTITGFFQGNPNLRPEDGIAWEAGIETDIASWATVSALYFDSRIRNLINFDQSFSTLENVDRARIRGGEFALTLRPADWFSMTGSWTVQEATRHHHRPATGAPAAQHRRADDALRRAGALGRAAQRPHRGGAGGALHRAVAGRRLCPLQ